MIWPLSPTVSVSISSLVQQKARSAPNMMQSVRASVWPRSDSFFFLMDVWSPSLLIPQLCTKRLSLVRPQLAKFMGSKRAFVAPTAARRGQPKKKLPVFPSPLLLPPRSPFSKKKKGGTVFLLTWSLSRTAWRAHTSRFRSRPIRQRDQSIQANAAESHRFGWTCAAVFPAEGALFAGRDQRYCQRSEVIWFSAGGSRRARGWGGRDKSYGRGLVWRRWGKWGSACITLKGALLR